MRCRAKVITVALIASAITGCKDDEPPRPREAPPATVSEVASALRVDAATLEVPSDPPPPAGDLRAEIDRFTTVEACAKARSGVDPLLGDALEAIGYDTFILDACRILDALKAKSAKKCAPIDASTLRSRCERLAAIAAGEPDACPFVVAGKPAFGRDATCVAAALRDPRLCAGEGAFERPACTALVSKDDKACASEARDRDKARCVRVAHRFAPLLEGGNPPAAGAAFKPTAHLTLSPLEGSPDAGTGDVDLSEEVTRGVVVVDRRDALAMTLGDFRESGYGFIPPQPVARPHLALEIESSASGKVTRAPRAGLGGPGVATLLTPAARSELKITVDKLEKTRGGAVKLVIDGEIGSPGRGYKVRYDVTTFVRDVVGPGAALAPALKSYGTLPDGGARVP